jgi:hypothetical protein
MTKENFVRHYDAVVPIELCQASVQYFEQMSAAGFGVVRNEARVRKDDEAVHVARDESLKLSASKNLSNALFEILPSVVKEYTEEFSVLETVGDFSIFDFKIQKTKIGGGYHVWHFESDSRRQGGRVLVYTIYLNDVEEGGETEFLYHPLRIKPKQGSVLIFPAGFTHTHRGNPPISNEKYIITGWLEF